MSTTDTLFTAFRVTQAANFMDLPINNNLYLFVGTSTTLDSNSPVVSPSDTVEYERQVRNEIIYLEQINPTNMALCIPNLQWTLGTVYAPYSSSDPAILSKKFYAVVGSNVYICISNNNGAPSTTPPIGTPAYQQVVADGYVWQFMYNISDILLNSFTTDDYVPVPIGGQELIQQITVQNAATPGTINQPVLGLGANASLVLGAFSVMISAIVTFGNINPTGIVTTTQFGLLLNPLDNNGNLLVNNQNVIDSNSVVNLNTGTLLHVEQFDTITSSDTDVSEEIQIVISF